MQYVSINKAENGWCVWVSHPQGRGDKCHVFFSWVEVTNFLAFLKPGEQEG